MLKVMIADDEEHICRLIRALVDWDALQMEIAGTASNGIEAAELAAALHPDILITDIRMPGCDGLELIQKVKESNPQLEIIIISGYAHFSYAQTAIKYGVGDYLLKPINKIDLEQTLKKLSEKIIARTNAENDRKFLLENHENNKNRARNSLIVDLLEKGERELSEEILAEEYHFYVKPGIFQGICLKMDYDAEQINDYAKKIVFEKAIDMIQGNLKSLCYEFIINMKEDTGYGVMNYPIKVQDDVRRILRDCLNQLTVQKSILGPVDFSIALGTPVREVHQLSKSLKASMAIIQERILTGPGHFLEKLSEQTGMLDKNLLEKYSRMMLHAVEVLSVEEGDAAVEMLREAVLQTRNIRGSEIFDLVISAGSLFLMQTEHKKDLEVFSQNLNRCAAAAALFNVLLKLQSQIIQEMYKERQDEELRPIRLAKQYIQSHYSEQITLEEVSDAVGLSFSYFSTLFKKEMGEGFAKYLMNVRIEQAKILLRETNSSVSDVCRLVGYNDIKHFTHTFEKATGLKPGAYRKLYG